MDKFSSDVLSELIDKYERSAIFKGASNIRPIRLLVGKGALAVYKCADSYKYIADNDEQLSALEGTGYIKVNRDAYGQLVNVDLNITNVDAIYSSLKRKRKSEELNKMLRLLQSYNCEGLAKSFIEEEIKYIGQNYVWHKKYYENVAELKELVTVLVGIDTLNGEVRERDFSVRVLGDSKRFGAIKNKIATIIKNGTDYIGESNDDTDTVLSRYNIVKNSTYALIKGDLSFKINNQSIDLRNLGFEYSLSDEMIKVIDFLPSNCYKLITVENLTSFHMLCENNCVIIFLSGFHNHTKQTLIKKIYDYYKPSKVYHFGDIDAGGFAIFNNLVQDTKIAFEPYRMGIEELKIHSGHLKSLTENDVIRLKGMLLNDKYQKFHSTIQYMLEKNVKLEQEVLD